jgi:hypothetical protein
MLGLHDVQYLYEFLFWLIAFLILKKVWHKPFVRMVYGYTVSVFNVLAIFFFTLMSITGSMNALDAFSFGFLHGMVAFVMLTLVRLSKKV